MIRQISTHFPRAILTNDDLAALFPGWSADNIYKKTGIRQRYLAAPDETASDLAFQAAEKLLAAQDRSSVDFLFFCSQTPDYFLPTTACLLQPRLRLPNSIGALDFNLGCSGYIYGLSLAVSLISSSMASNVLLLNADTYTKFLDPKDRATRTIFGDASAATLLSTDSPNRLHSFVFGTDGSGGDQLIMKGGGARHPRAEGASFIHMDGPEVFNFTVRTLPPLVESILKKAELTLDQIDLVIFHQANAFILEHLRRKLNIPDDKFVVCLEHCGNTVSATIPIALESAWKSGRLKSPSRLLLAGFGVGLSWAGCILDWNLK